MFTVVAPPVVMTAHTQNSRYSINIHWIKKKNLVSTPFLVHICPCFLQISWKPKESTTINLQLRSCYPFQPPQNAPLWAPSSVCGSSTAQLMRSCHLWVFRSRPVFIASSQACRSTRLGNQGQSTPCLHPLPADNELPPRHCLFQTMQHCLNPLLVG